MKKRLISIPFFLLRTTTAGAALVTGLLQTYVFAHVLSPQRFSIFILVAAFGYSLWLIDFGIVKILFVRLRARFLEGDRSSAVAGHATAVVLFYLGLVSAGALLCFIFMATQTSNSIWEAAEFLNTLVDDSDPQAGDAAVADQAAQDHRREQAHVDITAGDDDTDAAAGVEAATRYVTVIDFVAPAARCASEQVIVCASESPSGQE